MADSGRIEGERVFCYECSHEWDRAHGGLTCPNCHSDFTEIRDTPPSPSPPSGQATGWPTNPPHPFRGHDPWAEDIPDPDEDDITTFEFNTGGGRGTFSFTSRTYRSGGGTGRSVNMDPAMADLTQNFEQLLTQIAGPQPQMGRNRSQPSPMPFAFPGMGQTPAAFGAFGTMAGGGSFHEDMRGDAQNIGSMQDVFSLLFQSLNGPLPGSQRQTLPGQHPNPFILLQGLLNPTGRQGDAVFTQEAFDQVMTQLMEQNQGSTAPGPASEAAISSLPTKLVDKDMMGNDGTAECSICMDNVEIGEVVTVLPCNHWFHGVCVKSWLKEHDTCPHCRNPITKPEDRESNGHSSPRTRRGTGNRRPSSVSSPRAPPPSGDGTRRHPFTLPDSPSGIREARNQFFGRSNNNQGGDDMSREWSHRSHSSHSMPRTRNTRSGSQSSGNNGGGWFARHNPFSGGN